MTGDSRSLTSEQKDTYWVIRERATGRVIMETFNANLIDKLRPEYEAVPIEKHLGDLNTHCKHIELLQAVVDAVHREHFCDDEKCASEICIAMRALGVKPMGVEHG